MPWGLYSVFLYVEVGDSAPAERRKGRVRLSLWDFIREDFFRRELFLVSLQGKETESHGILSSIFF